MKKLIVFVFCLSLGLAFQACNSDPEIELKDVKIEPSSISVLVGETETAEITDGNGGYTAEVTTGTSFASVAVAGNVVTVTGIKEGSSTITVTDKDGKTAALSVTVNAVPRQLELETESVSVAAGATETVEITDGNGGYTAEVTEGEDYASVSVSGTVITVTGIAEGSATISVTDKKGETADLAVTVTPVLKELKLEKSSISVVPDYSKSVAITDGNGGYAAQVTQGTDVVSAVVSENNGAFVVEVTALKEGTAKVTVTDGREQSAELSVTVAPMAYAAAEQNLDRGIAIAKAGITAYYRGTLGTNQMREFYNPVTSTGSGSGSCWSFTMGIEAVNAILNAINAYKELGGTKDYQTDFDYFKTTLATLYENIKYYKGTYPAPGLVSFTQTKRWSVYAVPRSGTKGNADVTGVKNVYDDQEWLIREMVESYRATGNEAYLTEAEYLTEYVLDGWDCTLDGSGKEYGGIPWGPGYNSMHACSNGPMVSPLVWLYDIYKDKPTETTIYRYIGADKARLTETVKKSDHYLNFAKKVYNYHKTKFMAAGVYNDMVGAYSGTIPYETVGGVEYRAHAALSNGNSPEPHSYNSGTMLSGAADLYRVTGDGQYMVDAKALAGNAFSYFAKADSSKPGCYIYKNTSTFCRWFDCVLFRGYIDLYPFYNNISICIGSFQNNLDYAYANNLRNGFLPPNLLNTWDSSENAPGGNPPANVVVHATFSYATEYATLARYELEKQL